MISESNKYYVYLLIRNDDNNPFYVGKGCNGREKDHRRRVIKDNHSNIYLQRHIKKLWKNNLDYCEYIFIRGLSEEKALSIEIKTIKYYKNLGYKLYNLTDGGRGTSGTKKDLHGEKNPFYDKKHKKESREAMSKWKKKNYLGEKNPFYGKKHNWETKKKISKSQDSSKLSKEDTAEIYHLLKYSKISMNKIAKKFNVSHSLILLINKGERVRVYFHEMGIKKFPVRSLRTKKREE